MAQIGFVLNPIWETSKGFFEKIIYLYTNVYQIKGGKEGQRQEKGCNQLIWSDLESHTYIFKFLY